MQSSLSPVLNSQEKTYPTGGEQQKIQENIQLIGLLFFIAQIIGRGRLAILIYYIIKKESMSQPEKETCYGIFNFLLSYFLYTMGLSGLAMGYMFASEAGWIDHRLTERGLSLDYFRLLQISLPVGIMFIVFIIGIIQFIFSIMGLIAHNQGHPYKYPLSIAFFKI